MLDRPLLRTRLTRRNRLLRHAGASQAPPGLERLQEKHPNRARHVQPLLLGKGPHLRLLVVIERHPRSLPVSHLPHALTLPSSCLDTSGRCGMLIGARGGGECPKAGAVPRPGNRAGEGTLASAWIIPVTLLRVPLRSMGFGQSSPGMQREGGHRPPCASDSRRGRPHCWTARASQQSAASQSSSGGASRQPVPVSSRKGAPESACWSRRPVAGSPHPSALRFFGWFIGCLPTANMPVVIIQRESCMSREKSRNPRKRSGDWGLDPIIQRLGELCAARHWTQTVLAHRMGMDPKRLSALKQGDRGGLYHSEITALHENVGVNLNWLFTGHGPIDEKHRYEMTDSDSAPLVILREMGRALVRHTDSPPSEKPASGSPQSAKSKGDT